MMLRRFNNLPKPEPEMVKALARNHPAVIEGRTLFPTTVADPDQSPNALVSGMNNRKIGKEVRKGEWAGMPIFMLTLEERATCPRTCEMWRDCYGNAMHWARRHKHGEALEARIVLQLKRLSLENPRGFLVRLHILGDFYSPEYVDFWISMMAKWPALHLYGYTARRGCEIANRITELNSRYADRCVIRTSGVNAIVANDDAPVAGGFICPAETSSTKCCATCGLCWANSVRNKSVVFLRHGMMGTGRKKAA